MHVIMINDLHYLVLDYVSQIVTAQHWRSCSYVIHSAVQMD